MLKKLIFSLIGLTSAVNANELCNQVTEIPSTECQALVALYNSTNGDSWKNNRRWLKTNTPCSWERVSCRGGHVVMLLLYHNQLTGSIPAEIALLSNLDTLDLSGNKLCGKIPESALMSLNSLLSLSLQGNNLINDESAYGNDFIVWLNEKKYTWRSQKSPSYCCTSAGCGDKHDNDKKIVVRSDSPPSDAQLESPDTASVTITDNVPTLFSCNNVTEIPKKECKALVALYDSTDGENWVDSSGWKATNTPCDWYGVDCRNKHVTGLTLENNNIKGAISKKFFKLRKLESIVLSYNDLNGTRLNNINKLKNLEILLVNNSNLSG